MLKPTLISCYSVMTGVLLNPQCCQHDVAHIGTNMFQVVCEYVVNPVQSF
jgi:hypothetical protein